MLRILSRRPRLPLLFASLFLVLFSSSSAFAGAADSPPPSDTGVVSHQDIEEIRIVYPPPAALRTAMSRQVLESGRARNLSEALREVPGLDGVRRGASGLEPVIRGLGWERVQIQLEGLPVVGAGPGRMDTPATLFGPVALQQVEVIKGLPSLTLGPGGTGGRVLLSTDFERQPDSGSEVGGRVQASYGSEGNGFNGLAVVQGGSDRLDAHMGVDARRSGRYESAGGVVVPDSAVGIGGALSLGYRPAEGHRVWFGYIDSSYWDEEFPSLPMDSEKGWARIANGGYRIEREEGSFARGVLRWGYSGARHWMNNHAKPTMGMLAATKGEADSIFLGLSTDWRFGSSLELSTGFDFHHLQRDAVRVRTGMMMMSGVDHLWPDVVQYDAGFFAELRAALGREWQLRVGARLDQVESDARAADDASIGGLSVREQYVAHSDSADAADVRRGATLGSGNLLLEWRGSDSLEAHASVGIVSRAPAVTERYFAFANAPGGYQVGNPALDPERKTELELGGAWHSKYLDASFQAFHAWVHDYILRTRLPDETVMGQLSTIRGFRNTDARLYGAEANVTVYLPKYLSLPITLAYVRGRNTSAGRDLPEIPPFEIRAALHVEAEQLVPWWGEFGVRVATRQSRIDASFGEDATPSFKVFHLRGGVEPCPGLHLELAVENLLDEDYHEHLTREAPVASGGLARGDEVPAPGRSVFVTARWEF